MLPVFILALIVLSLTIDGVVQRRALARALTVQAERVGSAEWLRRNAHVPDDVVLAPGHVWLRQLRGGRVRLGADCLPAALLGEPDRVELPAPDARVARDQVLAVLARGGRELDLRCPIDGVVTRVQTGLGARPERVARAPFGRGWLVEVRPSEPLAAGASGGRAGQAARGWLRGEMDRLRDLVIGLAAPAGTVGATALDGGAPVLPVSPALDDQGWARVRAQFFSPEGRSAGES